LKTSHRIVLNTITTWTAIAVNIIVSFIVVPFLLNRIGIEGYGLIALTWALISFSLFADLGIGTSLSRNLSEQLAKKNTKRFNELFSSGFFIFLMIGFIIALISIFLAVPLTALFQVSAASKPQAIFLIHYFVGPVICISFMNFVFASILSCNNRFDLISSIDTASSIFRGIGILIVLSFTDTGLYGWALVSLTSRLLSLVSLYWAACRTGPEFRIRIRNVKTDAIKELFLTGRYIFFQQLSSIIRLKINPIILSVFLGPSAAALYKPAENISITIMPIIYSFASQLFPLATGYHTKGDIDKIKAVLFRGTRYTFLLAIPVCVILGIFAKPIIKLWLERSVGHQYIITASVVFFMVLNDLFFYAGGTQGVVLLGMNRLKFVSIMLLIFTVLNLGAAIFLVGYTSIGILGVIIPTVFSSGLYRIITTVHVVRLCRLPLKQYMLESYARPFIVFSILCLVAICFQKYFNPETFFPLLFCVFSILLIWIGLCWAIGFGRSDKREFINLSKSTWRESIRKSSLETTNRALSEWQ